MFDDPRSYSTPPSPTGRVSGIVGWFIGTMYILCFHVTHLAQGATCELFARYDSLLSYSAQLITVRLYSLTTEGCLLYSSRRRITTSTSMDLMHLHVSSFDLVAELDADLRPWRGPRITVHGYGYFSRWRSFAVAPMCPTTQQQQMTS